MSCLQSAVHGRDWEKAEGCFIMTKWQKKIFLKQNDWIEINITEQKKKLKPGGRGGYLKCQYNVKSNKQKH